MEGFTVSGTLGRATSNSHFGFHFKAESLYYLNLGQRPSTASRNKSRVHSFWLCHR